MMERRAATEFIGHRLLDGEGRNVGTIEQVFLDDRTETPTWLSVQTGMLRDKHSLVPMQGARPEDEDLRVPYDKDAIKDAPRFDVDRHLSRAEEEELCRHYGLQPPGPRTEGRTEGQAAQGRHAGGTGTRAGTPGAAEAEEDMTVLRSEERAHIGTETEETGRARVHKSVETEHFERDVPVTREELRVERVPLTDEDRAQAAETPRMEEQDEEIILHSERAVVSKESVPVEKVRISKQEVSDTQHVEGELRKEHIDVEQEGEERGPAS